MRKLIPFFLLFLLSGMLIAQQQRILVAPDGRTIPIQKGESAMDAAKRASSTNSTLDICNRASFGYVWDDYTSWKRVLFSHICSARDIWANWFVAPAAGTIDSVFFYNSYRVESPDSMYKLILLKSNIYPGVGPGYMGPGGKRYPYLPSYSTWPAGTPGKRNGEDSAGNIPVCWGYYRNTNDDLTGIAAWREDATDTTWISSIDSMSPGAPGTYPPTFPPIGESIWGFPGFPVPVKPDVISAADLSTLGAPPIKVGDPFFICLIVPGVRGSGNDDDPTYSLMRGEPVWGTDTTSGMGSHTWKFYETASYCGPGWLARGSWNLYIWYSMTTTSHIPPKISDVSALQNTVETGPQAVDVTLTDCYPAAPESAGIASATIHWKLNGIDQTPIPMTILAGDTWEANIPGAAGGSTVEYYVSATNLAGLSAETHSYSYLVVKLRTEWYMIDQSYSCTSHDIRPTGTMVDTAAFFINQITGHGTATGDDGTAGPYDIGKKFVFFGDTVRWAWIGINGSLTLSKTATDTIDANANGFYTTGWSFPYPIYHHRGDTTRQSASYIPPNIMLPFWNDLLYRQDSPRAKFGRILYGNAGDTCLFIVEWDSLGIFQASPLPNISDISRFRIVLNKCNGTVTFEYDNVGAHGLDSTALVGMQGDSTELSGPTPGYIFANQNVYPLETKPTNGHCIHFVPEIGFYANDGWNMVSAAASGYGGNFSKAYLFPKAISPAFAYQSGYKQADPLSNGPGYWMKFSGAQYVGALGTLKTSLSTPIADKWNMIGSISVPLPTASLVTTPPGIISSNIFGYRSDSGYTVTSSIMPGHAYWVKTSGGGTLDMSASAIVPKTIPVETELAQASKITIVDARGKRQDLYLAQEGTLSRPASMFELPPPAPDGGIDVRFSSERMLESYPAKLDEGKSCEYTVSVNSAAYPLVLRWDMKSAPTDHSFILSDAAGGKVLGNTILSGRGQVKIANASVKKFAIRLASGVTLPKAFALSQNYPNPFNPTTRFEVAIPKLATVDIVVYDVLGRKITTLLSGMQPAGYMTLEWNGRDSHNLSAPTGIYFVRMTSDDFSATRKILLMK